MASKVHLRRNAFSCGAPPGVIAEHRTRTEHCRIGPQNKETKSQRGDSIQLSLLNTVENGANFSDLIKKYGLWLLPYWLIWCNNGIPELYKVNHVIRKFLFKSTFKSHTMEVYLNKVQLNKDNSSFLQ